MVRGGCAYVGVGGAFIVYSRGTLLLVVVVVVVVLLAFPLLWGHYARMGGKASEEWECHRTSAGVLYMQLLQCFRKTVSVTACQARLM